MDLPEEKYEIAGLANGSMGRKVVEYKGNWYDINLMWIVLAVYSEGMTNVITYEPGEPTYDTFAVVESNTPDISQDDYAPALAFMENDSSMLFLEGLQRIKKWYSRREPILLLPITPYLMETFRIHRAVAHESHMATAQYREEQKYQIEAIGGPTVNWSRWNPPTGISLGVWASQIPWLVDEGYVDIKNNTYSIRYSNGVLAYLKKVTSFFEDENASFDS